MLIKIRKGFIFVEKPPERKHEAVNHFADLIYCKEMSTEN